MRLPMCIVVAPTLYRFRYMADYWSNFNCRWGGGCLSVTHWLGGVTPKFRIAKFGFKKLTTSLYHMVYEGNLEILNRLRTTDECGKWQMDRRTDIVIANAALHYVVDKKVLSLCVTMNQRSD